MLNYAHFGGYIVLVVPEEDIATFRDDFTEYVLTISTGELYIPLYATEYIRFCSLHTPILFATFSESI